MHPELVEAMLRHPAALSVMAPDGDERRLLRRAGRHEPPPPPLGTGRVPLPLLGTGRVPLPLVDTRPVEPPLAPPSGRKGLRAIAATRSALLAPVKPTAPLAPQAYPRLLAPPVVAGGAAAASALAAEGECEESVLLPALGTAAPRRSSAATSLSSTAEAAVERLRALFEADLEELRQRCESCRGRPHTHVATRVLELLSRWASMLPRHQAMLEAVLQHARPCVFALGPQREYCGGGGASTPRSTHSSSANAATTPAPEPQPLEGAALEVRQRSTCSSRASAVPAPAREPQPLEDSALEVFQEPDLSGAAAQGAWLQHLDVVTVLSRQPRSLEQTSLRRSGICADGVEAPLAAAKAAPAQVAPATPAPAHFTVWRQLRWHLASLRGDAQSCQSIVDSSKRHGSAAATVMNIMHEQRLSLVGGKAFAIWRLLAAARTTMHRQALSVRVLPDGQSPLRKAFLALRIGSGQEKLDRLDRMCREQHEQAAGQFGHKRRYERVHEDLSEHLQRSEVAAAFQERCLRDQCALRASLADRVERAQPDRHRRALAQVLPRFFQSLVQVASVHRVASLAALRTRELIALDVHRGETLKAVVSQPFERVLLRWVNQLLDEAKFAASGMLENFLSDGNTMSLWSTRDAPLFKERCRLVRGMHTPVNNFGKDLCGGVELVAVAAMMIAYRLGRRFLDPVHLWPLDRRAPELRAEGAYALLQGLAPHRAARCLLRPQDIAQGSAGVLRQFLAVAFLNDPPGPAKLPGRLEDEDGEELESEPDEEQAAGAEEASEGTSLDSGPEDEEEELVGPGMLSIAQREATEEGVQAAGAAHQGDEDAATTLAKSLEQAARGLAYERVVDLSPLLASGETAEGLRDVPPEEVLLRWLNHQVGQGDPALPEAGNLGEDLSDGRLLLALLRRVAPDVAQGADAGEEEPDGAAAVAGLAARCGDGCQLPQEALRSGQEDQITAFVASVFRVRPNLSPEPTSALALHIK
ncbi:unnamed protein product [Prorocentrum cordatum]|uniref:Calponin-homology (CH) domain-containing protein n=1 Tax=Prorocentrum cordatum TaxID=2364126 RepID=A0ABN9UKL6_9DINO|nr:unnamed protein product [Polarella glacialis]